ncbi:MAG: hypothetical protein AAGC71_04880 [Pseudomonadota bacterium]
MPIDYQLLLLAHVLLFVYWLGGDLGVFYSSFVVVNPNNSIEARTTAAKILIALDQVPRMCLVLILPVGISLAARLGLIDGISLVTVWLVCCAWLAMVIGLHFRHERWLGRLDTILRSAVAIAALIGAWLAFTGDALTPARWVAVKLAVFGLIVGCGLAIRIAFAPFGPAFATLVRDGSSPDVEAVISGSLARSRPFVVAIWALLIAAAWLGLTKPALA